MKSRFIFTAVIAGIALVTFGQAQSHKHPLSSGKGAPTSAMPMMMMDMNKCMADMAAGQAKLDRLAVKMNAVQGADRIDATSAVVTEMVKQQKEMGEMCMAMMHQMGSQPIVHGHKMPIPEHGNKPGKGSSHVKP